MAKFIVCVQKRVEKEIEVEAENEQEACNNACDIADSEDFSWGDPELSVLYADEKEE